MKTLPRRKHLRTLTLENREDLLGELPLPQEVILLEKQEMANLLRNEGSHHERREGRKGGLVVQAVRALELLPQERLLLNRVNEFGRY